MDPTPTLATSVGLALALLLAGCADPGPRDGAAGRAAEVVFTTLSIREPESLDPAVAYEVAGGAVIQQVLEPLVYYDKASPRDLVPVVAVEVPTLANGGMTPDGMAYTFRLRQDLRFHDRTPLSAEDVKFSLDRAILVNAPAGPAWLLGTVRGAAAFAASPGTQDDREAYLALGGVEVLGPWAVRIHLDRPDAAFLHKVAFTVGSVVPRAAFLAPHPERAPLWGAPTTPDGLPPPAVDANRDGDLDDPGDQPAVARDPWAERNLVGTGPFTLAAWRPGEVELRRYADYQGLPRPQVDRVLIRKVLDTRERIDQLARGLADDIYVDAGDLALVAGLPAARVVETPSFNIDVLVMPRLIAEPGACPVDALTGQRDCAFFTDPSMRKVFAHAFDHDRFVRDVAGGHVARIAGVVPRGMFGHDWDLAPYDHDPVEALTELVRSRHPGGFRITLSYTEGNTLREGAARLLKEGLEGLSPGIQVDLRALDGARELLPAAKRKALAAYFLGWAPDYAFPDDYVVPFAHPERGIIAQFAGLEDPALSALVEEALAEVRPVQLHRRYIEVQRHMHETYAYVYLYQANHVHVEGTWVSGYFYNPMDAGQPTVGKYQYIGKG